MKDVGFSLVNGVNHVRGFYGRLVEYLYQEIGDQFEVIDSNSYGRSIRALDGKYRIVIFAVRRAAAELSSKCGVTRSLLVDHGVLHTNRTPSNMPVDFELFSSVDLLNRYSESGLMPLRKGWGSRYFLTSQMNRVNPLPRECLLYLIGSTGRKANSKDVRPFDEASTIDFIRNLARLFSRVHVIEHINMAGDLISRISNRMPDNVVPASHGSGFLDLICNVEAVFFEYSSVMASALWNPDVKIFQRVPPRPSGPTTPQAALFHEAMEQCCYPIVADDLSQVAELLASDPKANRRREMMEFIYGPDGVDPYASALAAIREAVEITRCC